MQAGEDPALDVDALCEVIRTIKRETPLAVTLSLGERTPAELLAFRHAGADRYLLRFETSNLDLLAPTPSAAGRARRRTIGSACCGGCARWVLKWAAA